MSTCQAAAAAAAVDTHVSVDECCTCCCCLSHCRKPFAHIRVPLVMMEVIGFIAGLGFLFAAALLSWHAASLDPASFWRACLAILSNACTMAPIATVSVVLVRLVLGKGLSRQYYLSQKRTQARCGLPAAPPAPAPVSMHEDHGPPNTAAASSSSPITVLPSGPASAPQAPRAKQQPAPRRQHTPIAPLITTHVPIDNVV